MLCNNHQNNQAVGVCSKCGEGQCVKCHQDSPYHCSKSHKGCGFANNGFLCLLIGLAFILHSYLRTHGYQDFFLIELGGVLILFGLYRLLGDKMRCGSKSSSRCTKD